MITRNLLKREIDKVRDEHLTDLYRFTQETYGCLQDDPIERGSQGEYELRDDMLELQERNAAGQLRFLSHKEVWGE